MLQSPTASTAHEFRRSGQNVMAALGLGWFMIVLSIALPNASRAQDWGGESDDGWSQSTIAQDTGGASTGWSLGVGIGFIDDPTAFLLNFEAP